MNLTIIYIIYIFYICESSRTTSTQNETNWLILKIKNQSLWSSTRNDSNCLCDELFSPPRKPSDLSFCLATLPADCRSQVVALSRAASSCKACRSW